MHLDVNDVKRVDTLFICNTIQWVNTVENILHLFHEEIRDNGLFICKIDEPQENENHGDISSCHHNAFELTYNDNDMDTNI